MSSSAESTASPDRSFFWRRLHSVSGVFPVGAFLLEHLYTNSYAINGVEAYNEKVRGLTELPMVLILEIAFIYIPIAYHALYGVWVWWRGDGNVTHYPWTGNWMYSLQRWTGLVTMAYIAFHVWEQRFAGVHIIENYFVAFSKVQHSIARPAVHAFYVVGLLSACFHFAYGLWLFACKWGFAPGRAAQKKLLWACAALFLVLSSAGLMSLRSISTAPLQPRPEELLKMRSQKSVARSQGPEAAGKRSAF
ncbi:MAG: succinate dehydrogenase [Acidobacteria bacterium]|nr:succinate dehydrogenase [Acidobacteriota bacterium]